MVATSQRVVALAELSAEQRLFSHVKQALRVMVEWRAPAVSQRRKRTSVRFALRSFCRHLERLMAFEEQGGYLPGVAAERPNWRGRVDQLAQEHAGLRDRIQRLGPVIDDPSVWESDQFDGACLEIRELLDEVDRHDRDEIALLQESFTVDEGGGD